MIEVSHLHKVFTTPSGPVTVLDDVTFSVSGGEVFAVVGPSGAGKSTLTQCLNLLQRPTSGEVIVNGENLAHLDAGACGPRGDVSEPSSSRRICCHAEPQPRTSHSPSSISRDQGGHPDAGGRVARSRRHG